MRYELVEDKDGKWFARMRRLVSDTIVWRTKRFDHKEEALNAIEMVEKPTHHESRMIASGYSSIVRIIEVRE